MCNHKGGSGAKLECKWLREQRIENRVFVLFPQSQWTREMYPFDDRQR